MNLFEYEYNGKQYQARMSYRAKVEIDKANLKQMEKFGDPDLIKASKLLVKANGNGVTEEERSEIMMEVMPYVGKLNELNSALDPVDLLYILLRSNPNHKDLTREDFELLEWDMEEKLGFEELMETLQGIHDKVFTLVEKMNTPKDKKEPAKKATKKMNKTIINSQPSSNSAGIN